MSLILAIETSNPSSRSGVALVSSDAVPGGRGRMSGRAGELRTLGVAWLGEDGRGRTLPGEPGGLMPTIERLFREAGLGPQALRAPGSKIAVSIGPGGYTSVRVAVTAAKLVSEASGAACVAVPTASVVARRVVHAGAFAVVLASKRETAWITVFEGRGSADAPVRARREPLGLWDEDVVEVLEESGVGLMVGDRFMPPEMRERATDAGILLSEPTFDPLACAELGLAASGPHDDGYGLGTDDQLGTELGTDEVLEAYGWGYGLVVDALSLRPLYPREPEAVTKWRALRGG